MFHLTELVEWVNEKKSRIKETLCKNQCVGSTIVSDFASDFDISVIFMYYFCYRQLVCFVDGELSKI